MREAKPTPHLNAGQADGEGTDRSRRNALRGALIGFVIGLVFPITAWLVAGATTGSASVLLIRQDQPVTWVIDLIPFVLAGIGAVVATTYGRFVALQSHTAEIAERIADEWTHEIHDHNVEIARNAASQAKFFAAPSHDMRTPLSANIGFSSLVAEGEEDIDDMKVMGDEIRTCADQLLTMINDLLDAANSMPARSRWRSMTSRGTTSSPRSSGTCSPSPTRRASLWRPTSAPQAPGGSIGSGCARFSSTSSPTPSSTPRTARSSSARDSAAVSSPCRSRTPASASAPRTSPRSSLRSTAAQQRIDSTGLGLPVSLGLAEAMDGTIMFHSEGAGCGSTFTLTVPRGTGSDAEARFATLPSLNAAA